MILKASQRGGAKALACHLLNADDNEHIEVHAINGFMAADITGALQEIEAIARATRCKQPLFSLSLSPPKGAVVTDQDFQDAIEASLERTGLSDQPYVVIFHEKHGRRHAHLVVSRIDTDAMKAINLSFFKDRLMELSRELFVTHGWEMPKGHEDRTLTDPLNYSLEEYQVAFRAQRDPQAIKAALQAAWAHSDGKTSFQAALREVGFSLARGDRRGFVAVDVDGNVYSLSRWLGLKTKELKGRLGAPSQLPSVAQVTATLEEPLPSKNNIAGALDRLDAELAELVNRKSIAIAKHRADRAAQNKMQEQELAELVRASARSRRSLRGVFQWITGQADKLALEQTAQLTSLRDKHDLAKLALSNKQSKSIREMRERIAELNRERDGLLNLPEATPRFDLVPIRDHDAQFTVEQIRKSPERILEVLTDTRADFSKHDIRRALARFIPKIEDQDRAIRKVLNSPELLEKSTARFTTNAYAEMEGTLLSRAHAMAQTKAFGVSPHLMKSAIEKQSKALQKAVGANLSDQQCEAIKHVLNRRQLCSVVGYAGAGKSTMLAAAYDAWSRQGYRTFGAALAGKAADGLQNASGIPSRTLASWEMSWRNGRNLLLPGDVFVVDEAGMVGSAQLARVIEEVQKRQAKLVLVGDPAQLQPINAGTPFSDIIKETGAARLTEVRRQKLEWQKQASIDLAEERIDEAMHAYEINGFVTRKSSTEDAIASLVEAYMADLELHGAEKTRLALAHSRIDVHAINEAIRAARRSAGELQEEFVFETALGPRAFAPGDRVVFGKNVRDLGVRNGTTGLVTILSGERVTVSLDDGRSVNVSMRQYKNVDYGYATTIHRSQGSTVDNAFVFANPKMPSNLKYVAMSRHRDELQVFTSHKRYEKSRNELAHEVGAKANKNLELRDQATGLSY